MKLEIIKFFDYKTPCRAHYNDSGADVFANTDYVIKSHSVLSIPLGIGVKIPDGYDLVVHCKSGLSNKGIWASNAPIDAGYRGEIHAILYNTTDEDFKIKSGTKIGQLVMRPVIYPEFVENIDGERGVGAFGSTGER